MWVQVTSKQYQTVSWYCKLKRFSSLWKLEYREMNSMSTESWTEENGKWWFEEESVVSYWRPKNFLEEMWFKMAKL